MLQHDESQNNNITDSAKQHAQQYIAQVCEQVRWKKAHPVVQEELLAHIEDQAEAFQHEGYTADEAEYLAVEQMGDPILAGGQFDKVYRPRMEWNVLLMVGSLILLGNVLRFSLQIASGVPVDWGVEIVKILATLPFLVLGYCMDYTALLSGKFAAVFTGFVAILTSYICTKYMFVNGGTLAHYMIPLWLLLFVITLYRVRQKGRDGFLLLFAEHFFLLLIFIICYGLNPSGILAWVGVCFVLMLYGLKIDWFGCSKRWGFLFLIYPFIFLWFVLSRPYRINRILGMFTPYSDPMGWGYVPCQILDVMQNANFIGSGGVNLAYLTEHLPDMHTDYILTTALSHWGWLSIVVVLLSYGLFFTLCFMACKKVKSQMGKFVIVAITSCWVLQFASYLIINFTTLQMSTYPLLFVQGGYMRMVNLFLLGIVLSVYKTGAVQKDAVWKENIAQKAENPSKVFYG